jgi:hypothetical protein
VAFVRVLDIDDLPERDKALEAAQPVNRDLKPVGEVLLASLSEQMMDVGNDHSGSECSFRSGSHQP